MWLQTVDCEGGLIAQELALADPKLVRRLVLVGTGPRSGQGMASKNVRQPS
jgi:pimeloyl-ACP methyl ester carboxylesterase